MDAQFLCFPTRIRGKVSVPLEVAHVAGILLGDYLQIVSEVSVVATLTFFSSLPVLVPQNVPMKPWLTPYGRWIILVFPPVLHG